MDSLIFLIKVINFSIKIKVVHASQIVVYIDDHGNTEIPVEYIEATFWRGW